MLYVLTWWLVLQLIALLGLPLTMRLFRFLPDRGVPLARPLGLILTGYLFWLLVSLGLLQNMLSSLVLVLAIVGTASAIIWLRSSQELLQALSKRRCLVLLTELLFLVALASFAFFRAYNPDIAATEKPMEFAFINGILRSRTFPPSDPWLSGFSISYYYFGYVMAAMLTTLSGIPSDISFNLMGGTLFALTITGAFCIVYNLVQANRQHESQDTERGVGWWTSFVAVGPGLLSSIMVALMGNLEGVFELIRARGGGSEALWRWLDVKNLHATAVSSKWYPDDMWWWWRASRVIHDKDTLGASIEVIDEFPFFSFLLGDNHPHVLALPFVLLALGLALNLMLSFMNRAKGAGAAAYGAGTVVADKVDWGQRIGAYLRGLWTGGLDDWFLWALCLGAIGFLNTWDFPIYLGIFVLAYAWWRYTVRPGGAGWVVDTVVVGGILLVAGLLLYAPFYVSFSSQAGGIGQVGEFKTRPHQYLLMVGVFVWAILGLLVALWSRIRQNKAYSGMPILAIAAGGLMALLALFSLVQGWYTAALCFALMAAAMFLVFWGGRWRADGYQPGSALPPSALFALILVACGMLLTVSVEFIYLRDTFDTRMNTVFKFYYQAWVLLALASAYGVYVVLSRWRKSLPDRVLGTAWAAILAVLVGAGLSYTVMAVASKANGFAGTPTLDGTSYVQRYRPDDYAAVQWLRENAPEGAVLLEAQGGSYSEYNWISAHSGVPTLLGWGGHELQWRGSYDEPGAREPDITAIYQGISVQDTLNLIDKYSIDYVVLGPLERAKYHPSPGAQAKLDRIMEPVFQQGGVIIYGWD